MAVHMGLDMAPGLQFGRHGADDGAARRVASADEVMHDRQGCVRQPPPTGLLLDHQFRPGLIVGEHQNQGLGGLVNLIGFLPMFLLPPRGFLLGQNGARQRSAIDRAKLPNAGVDVHAQKPSSRRTDTGT